MDVYQARKIQHSTDTVELSFILTIMTLKTILGKHSTGGDDVGADSLHLVFELTG
jgi:hypothetical protein